MAVHATVSLVAAETEAQAERASLQGTWRSVSGRREAEVLFAGYLFTVHFADGEVYMGAYQLDSHAHPKKMDMRIDEGPDKHRGKIAHCLYEVDGDTLRWCAVEPGSEERPTAFPSVYDTHHLSMVLQRELPKHQSEKPNYRT